MLMRQDAKSLDLGRAIYHKLHASADCHDLLKEARDWAVRFSQQRPEDIWLAEWVKHLNAALSSEKGRNDLYDLLLSPEQHAIDMRSSSPFSHVLTTKERTTVLLAFEAQWRKGIWHDGRAA
ncbi:hypothetical protein [Acidithiobacillus albertensis]|jgi:hypothetical protein|uniref:hypothetical protein n=1 Tax=Acidithiobacillus albertensis TaxID=119978 RepID=UPI000AC3CA87|nr:hypothetical protein [Acidithiobacillus albertensis]